MTTPPDIAAVAGKLTSEYLLALAARIKALPHQSREMDKELHQFDDGQFRYPYTGSLDMAKRLVPDGFVWCAGTALNDDGEYAWANVHDHGQHRVRADHSVHAATPEIALCTACILARMSLRQHLLENGGGCASLSTEGNTG